MEKIIHLKIVTPQEVLYEADIEGVTFPTMEGEITVLPNHLPIIAAVKPGEIKVKKAGKEEFFSVTRGVLEVDGKNATLLTDAGEKSELIDEKRAQEAIAQAKKLMSEKIKDEESYADAVAQMERALSRVRIARKRRRGGSSSIDQPIS